MENQRRPRQSVERFTLGIAGIMAAVVSVLDLLGLFDVPVLQHRFSQLTLLIVGLTLSTSAIISGYIERLSERINDLEGRLVVRSERIESGLEEISEKLSVSVLEQLPGLVEDVNPAMLATFRPYLEDVFRTPLRVVQSKRFRLESLESYRSYHRRALEVNVGATFFATSLPSKKWFWHGDYIERSIQEFIRQGGIIVRIFFVQDDESLSEDFEARSILDYQLQLGVEVYTLQASKMPPDYRRFFLVEKEGSFAWEAVRGPDDLISSLEVTADPQDIQNYLGKFGQLLGASTKYHRGRFASRQIGVGEGGNPVNYSKDPDAFREFEFIGWEHAVTAYHDGWSKLTGQAIPVILDTLGVTNGTRLLDVACGPGYLSAEATSRGGESMGLDFSPRMVEKASDLHPGLNFRRGNAEELPFESNTFDAVAMNFGMLHLANPEQAIREAYRVLKSGGKFAFTVWASPAEAKGFKLILDALERHGESVSVPHGPDFFFYSRPEECRVALTTAGFRTSSVMLVDLVWQMSSPDEMFIAFYEGTARTGGLLRRQPSKARDEIREELAHSTRTFEKAEGSFEIPMPAVLAWATKN